MTTPSFTFETSITRGRYEREYDLEVTYTVTPFIGATHVQPAEGGEVEVLTVTSLGASIDLTADEDETIYQACCDRAEADLAEWYAEQDDDRADYGRDDSDERKAA